MFLKTKGSATVFLCIILSVLIPLSCILIDIYRYSLAVGQAKTALKICSESVLAAYDRGLKEQYGLFAIHPRDKEAIEKEIFELLSQNLNYGASADGVTDLYGFLVRKVEAIPFYNLSEPFVLEQQAVEFMKYRAPVQVVQEFYEKLKIMIGLMKEGDMIERKMAVDKLMNNIREGMVNVSCMLTYKMCLINCSEDGADKNLKKSVMADVKSHISDAKTLIMMANELAAPVQEARTKYIALCESFKKAFDNYEYIKKEADDISAQISKKEAELDAVRNKLLTAKGDKAKSLEQERNALEAEISGLRESYAHIRNSCDNAYREYISAESEMNECKKEFDEKLSSALYGLENARLLTDSAKNEAGRVLLNITTHIAYHNDIIKLIDELTPKLKELEDESKSLLDDARDIESGVSDQISGSLQVQLKSIQAATLSDVRERLSGNLDKLESWKIVTQSFHDTLAEALRDLDNEIKEAGDAMEKPFEKSFEGYNSRQNVTEALKTFESGLSDLKSLDEMKGYFEIPEYALEPEVNNEELKAFEKWFNKRYHGIETKEETPKDEKELEDVRNGVGSFANEAAGQNDSEDENITDDINGSLDDIIERYLKLPSKKGATSSDEALSAIGRAIMESEQNRTVSFNPFDKPVEGLDTVNEKEKNFFDHEMERIKALLEIIGDSVSEGLESLIESLYMNEYIMSAFKCVTSTDGIEHDIGWGRPLDKTFLKQAEIEYILFGNNSSKHNISCVKRSIFAIRLVFNLLHVYTDPDKLAAALSLATAIAGWTVFGIPIVHNFILIAWAGMESYVDTDMLLKGKSVPLIKTSASWYLGANNLKNYLIKGVKDFVQDKIEDTVDRASEAVQETVTGMINGKIDDLFAPIEKEITDILGEPASADLETDNLLKSIGTILMDNLSFSDLESFKASLGTAVTKCFDNIKAAAASYSSTQLVSFKSRMKEYIRDLIFESSGYKKLEESVKKLGSDLLDKGLTVVEGQLDKVLGKAGNSGRNNIAGRLILMDYTDYLRIMLLAVPSETKALRTADLMQMNMQEITGNYDLTVDQYHTFIFIKAELDFNTWFLPESMFRKGGSGMISVEWSQGY
jgi:septal ring factor EnvC (AmiA/AmiB activator)